MLTICRRASVPHAKHHPRKSEKCWVVIKTEPGERSRTVFGPATHQACNKYILERQHE